MNYKLCHSYSNQFLPTTLHLHEKNIAINPYQVYVVKTIMYLKIGSHLTCKLGIFLLDRENRFYGGNFNFLTGKVIKSQEKQNIGEKSEILVGKVVKSQEKQFPGKKSMILDDFFENYDFDYKIV